MLITSDGESLSIDEIRASFNCDKIKSFKDFPKIFIIDVCRGENIPTAHTTTMMREKVEKEEMQLLGHNDDGFLIIWSTTQGYQIGDFSFVVMSKYKSGYPFKQMLNDVRQEIRKRNNGEWYC
ncbi:caspase 8-like protein, partial [Reticulomyxa filosa]